MCVCVCVIIGGRGEGWVDFFFLWFNKVEENL